MKPSELPEEWTQATPTEARSAEAELRREICADHVLHRVSVHCLAKGGDGDAYLFALMDHESALAVVHLTWSVEPNVEFPGTTFFADNAEFFDRWRSLFE